jgi:hypothetical protein
MSDSSKPDIPLESCHDQRSFRLLEIPSELLGLITSKIPPRYVPEADSVQYKPRLICGEFIFKIDVLGNEQ